MYLVGCRLPHSAQLPSLHAHAPAPLAQSIDQSCRPRQILQSSCLSPLYKSSNSHYKLVTIQFQELTRKCRTYLMVTFVNSPNVYSSDCPTRRVLDRIADKW